MTAWKAMETGPCLAMAAMSSDSSREVMLTTDATYTRFQTEIVSKITSSEMFDRGLLFCLI